MDKTERTVRLPESEAQFLEAYATEHAMTLTELLVRYAHRLHTVSQLTPHPRNLKLTGRVPADADVREEYRRHIESKHR
jgi:hypothetical protein